MLGVPKIPPQPIAMLAQMLYSHNDTPCRDEEELIRLLSLVRALQS
jgi:hypothetical protein